MKSLKMFRVMAYLSFALSIFPWTFLGIIYSGPISISAGNFIIAAWPISVLLALIAIVGMYSSRECDYAKIFAVLAILIVCSCLLITRIGTKKHMEFYETHPPAPRANETQ